MAEQGKTYTGGCMCGSIRYEVVGEPMEVGYCHCRMCQKSLGSVFGVFAMFERQGFRFTVGEPQFYRSSHAKQRSFCPNCGSPLTMWNADRAIQNHVGVLIGTLDNPELFPPQNYAGNHSGIESQIRWLKIEDGLPRKKTEEDQSYVSPRRDT